MRRKVWMAAAAVPWGTALAWVAAPPATTTTTTTALWSSSWEEEGPRSVGDVVQGLHGSKYAFGDAATNHEGVRFAETGYSSSSSGDDDARWEEAPLPDWFRRLQERATPSFLASSSSSARPLAERTVEIRNDERSWEVFYAFVVVDGGPSPELGSTAVTPWVGQLAPRGGAGGYPDAATLSVAPPTPGTSRWLVAATEAETWIYDLTPP